MKKIILLILSLSVYTLSADLGIDATLGTINPKGQYTDFNLDFDGHLWYLWDQMVLLGCGGGVQQFGTAKQYPIVLSGLIRLPIGGQMLPLISGDWGYTLGSLNEFLYKAGGGLDLKLGDNSSLIALLGYQNNVRSGAFLYSRAGILLEF